QNAARLLEVPQAMGTNQEPDGARASFAQMLADPTRRAAVRAAIENQAEHFDMLGLQLGYAYAAGALVADGGAPPKPANPVREFVPSCHPGARLPHGWIEHEGRRISTLDLIGLDQFTLLAGPAGDAWIEAAQMAPLPVRRLQLGRDAGDRDRWWNGGGMAAAGVLLVRPDQHVAFRSRQAAPDARRALVDAWSMIVGRAAHL